MLKDHQLEFGRSRAGHGKHKGKSKSAGKGTVGPSNVVDLSLEDDEVRAGSPR